eukprot:GHRQ01009683.1.p1 GENE.GHRQ01009683.1~~GHRQ01009683.1.p1  ORF type:complete len:210 (+),score=8.90 GHRQ01009683.1:529-1158(+)
MVSGLQWGVEPLCMQAAVLLRTCRLCWCMIEARCLTWRVLLAGPAPRCWRHINRVCNAMQVHADMGLSCWGMLCALSCVHVGCVKRQGHGSNLWWWGVALVYVWLSFMLRPLAGSLCAIVQCPALAHGQLPSYQCTELQGASFHVAVRCIAVMHLHHCPRCQLAPLLKQLGWNAASVLCGVHACCFSLLRLPVESPPLLTMHCSRSALQ